MNLLIDLRWVRSEVLDGIGRVSLSLTAALMAKKPEWTYLLLFENQTLKTFALEWIKNNLGNEHNTNYIALILGFGAQSPLNRLHLWTRVSPHKPQIYLSYYFIFHPLPLPQICMVHDLIPLIYPKYFQKASWAFKFFMTRPKSLRWLIKQSTHVLTVSHNTRHDLSTKLGIQPEKITVCYPGVNLSGDQSLQNLKPGYILSVGRPDPHKNFQGLIQAYAGLSPEVQAQHLLVLAGPQDERYSPTLQKTVADLKLEDKVIFTGPVPSEVLNQLYRNAAIFALPSFYEGFGLPIIEAMSCGVPVLTSTQGSLPEVSEQAALLVDPNKPQALSQALDQLLHDQNLVKRLRIQGRKRAAQFSWSASADSLLQVLLSLSQSH